MPVSAVKTAAGYEAKTASGFARIDCGDHPPCEACVECQCSTEMWSLELPNITICPGIDVNSDYEFEHPPSSGIFHLGGTIILERKFIDNGDPIGCAWFKEIGTTNAFLFTCAPGTNQARLCVVLNLEKEPSPPFGFDRVRAQLAIGPMSDGFDSHPCVGSQGWWLFRGYSAWQPAGTNGCVQSWTIPNWSNVYGMGSGTEDECCIGFILPGPQQTFDVLGYGGSATVTPL